METKLKVKVAQSYPILCDPMDYTVQGILQARIPGVGNRSLLQQIFPTQGSNPGLLNCRRILYQLSHQEIILKPHLAALAGTISQTHVMFYKAEAALCPGHYGRCSSSTPWARFQERGQHFPYHPCIHSLNLKLISLPTK